MLRLFYVQVIDKKYVSLARNNAIKEMDIYPTRGMVYDRTGELIVQNQPIYDLMVIPRQAKGIDTMGLCNLLGMTKEEFLNRFEEIKKQKGYSTYKPNPFIKQMSHKRYSELQESLQFYPGFFGQIRSVRNYPHRVAATILGDIGEVDDKQIEASGGYYKPGDYVGKSGIEKVYEAELGGRRGKKMMFVDVHNREVGSFGNGIYDTLPKAGSDVITTLHIKLQQYGEQLMQNKKGSIVAIEPATGEILALVSSPGYDPNLLCGAVRGENYKALQKDTMLPLYSRPTLAMYPPGSAFKPLVGLIALNEGAQGVNYTVPCNGFYYYGGLSLKCSHRHPSATNIQYALQQSCNPYFWQTFKNSIDHPIEIKRVKDIQESYELWAKYCHSFGIGVLTGIDLPSEKRGNVPSVQYLDRMYGKKRWKFGNIISLGIGQGEILMTPLQMANLYAAIANKGYWITPHVVKKITDPITKKDITHKYERHQTLADAQWFEPTIEGLFEVVEMGTARSARIPGITMCGKTGTAQNPHGEDHSMFAGFAPKDHPKIAIAVVVENGGYGATYAAPIASLMVEKYLNDTIQTSRLPIEKRMLEGNLLNRYGVDKPATRVPAGDDFEE